MTYSDTLSKHVIARPQTVAIRVFNYGGRRIGAPAQECRHIFSD